MLNSHPVIITEVLLAIAGVLGYYIGHRGWQGVINDLEDVKKDVSNLKAATTSAPAPVA